MIEFVKEYTTDLAQPDVHTLIQLSQLKGFGSGTLKKLLEHFNSFENIRQADRNDFLQIKGVGPKNAENILYGLNQFYHEEWEHADKNDYRILTIFDEDYPPSLLHLEDPPFILFVKGEITKQDKLSIGIVGSRGPTSYGKFQAERFGIQLANSGFTIVSGLAYGIDSYAHKAALHTGGRTIAVIGSGFGQIYPKEHEPLAEKIVDGNGALISEYPFNTPPKGTNFPVRNRIVAALSLGLLVVEARINSGSLITTRIAAELGKEIFAIPGPVHSPESEGPHKLINDGARLVQRPEDILEELGEIETILKPVMNNAHSEFSKNLNEDENLILACLGKKPIHFDDLKNHVDLEISELLSYLTLLEIKGALRSHPGQFYSLDQK